MWFPKWKQHTQSCPKRSGPHSHSPIQVSYVSVLIFFLGNTCYRHKKKKKKSFSVIFQSDYLGSDLGKCLSIITPFPKHCLSAVWRVRSAEFLSEINRGKGNFSHLCGVITATTSFETNLFVASLLFKNWLIPNLLSWWNLTASQLELAQPI